MKKRSFLFWILFLLPALILLGTCCFQKENPKSSGMENRSIGGGKNSSKAVTQVCRHVWDLMTVMDTEEEGFGMYTYVLFPRRLDQPMTYEVKERYAGILAAISGTTLSLQEYGKLSPRNKDEINLLYIPALKQGRKPTLSNYNSTLAMLYLARIALLCQVSHPELANNLERRPGPFLISLPSPIGQIGNEQVSLLYADLSTTNPDIMKEVIAVYKTRLAGKPVDKIEHFRSLRLALLNMILNADDNLQLVKVAMADLMEQ